MYNRDTKNLWIEHDDGSTEHLGAAATSVAAYNMIGMAGYLRVTDWGLCAGKSPLREAQIRTPQEQAGR